MAEACQLLVFLTAGERWRWSLFRHNRRPVDSCESYATSAEAKACGELAAEERGWVVVRPFV